jgi:threonine dehydratase
VRAPSRGLDSVRLGLDRIRGAVSEIDPVFLDTPALPCAPLGEALGCSVTLKVETLNPVRSFKGRGTETVAAVAQRARATRMICASAGNLGQALACAHRATPDPSALEALAARGIA